jgi:hypothetical protein
MGNIFKDGELVELFFRTLNPLSRLASFPR